MNRLVMLAMVVAAVGCKKKVDSEDFAARMTKRMAEIGMADAKVTCPSGIEAKTGTTFECTVATGGKTYAALATITSMKDNDLQMDTKWKDGEAVMSSKLEPMVAAELTKQLGTPVTVVCGEPLRFLDSARKVSCDLTSGSAKSKVNLTFDDKLVPTDYKIEPGLLERAKLEEALTRTVREKTEPDVVVTCGTEPLITRPEDGIVMCGIANPNKQAKIKVEIDKDLNMTRWDVVD